MSLCRLVRIRTFVAEARGAGEEAGAEADFQVLENSKGEEQLTANFFCEVPCTTLSLQRWSPSCPE